jgi:hypothetical protein
MSIIVFLSDFHFFAESLMQELQKVKEAPS